MNWTEHRWLEFFLPNYLKPLKDPRIETEQTKDFVKHAEEFLSDLAALTELPRLNKTFKRNIKGYLFHVKIKPRKIHLELQDTKKSSADIKKRVYITILRKNVKSVNGRGKCIEANIYYRIGNETIVRNIRNHPYFQGIFDQLHILDVSLSTKDKDKIEKEIDKIKKDTLPTTAKGMLGHSTIEKQLNEIIHKYGRLDALILTKLEELKTVVSEYIKDFDLLDIEEKHHVKRLVNEDLPNLLSTYESLTEEQKKKTYEDVIYSIHSMRVYIQNQKKQLNKTRMDRMNQLLKLNQLRYQQPLRKLNKEEDI